MTRRRRSSCKSQSDVDAAEVLRGRLPELIVLAFESYETLARSGDLEGPRESHAHHTACKSAVQHVDSLLKVWRFFDPQVDLSMNPAKPDADDLIAEARKALIGQGNREP